MRGRLSNGLLLTDYFQSKQGRHLQASTILKVAVLRGLNSKQMGILNRATTEDEKLPQSLLEDLFPKRKRIPLQKRGIQQGCSKTTFLKSRRRRLLYKRGII